VLYGLAQLRIDPHRGRLDVGNEFMSTNLVSLGSDGYIPNPVHPEKVGFEPPNVNAVRPYPVVSWGRPQELEPTVSSPAGAVREAISLDLQGTGYHRRGGVTGRIEHTD
jgi:hypothetical protein